MSFEEKGKKQEQTDSQENKSEKELSLLEVDELLKKSEKVSDNLDKFSKDEIYKKENFEDLRVTVDKLDDGFDEEAYAKAGFWKKFENFTRFGFQKERYNLVRSKYGELLDKTKIDEDIIGRGIEIKQNNKQEKEYLEKNIIDIQGDFKKDNSERLTAKSFEFVDGEIIKYVSSARTEKGQIEAAGKMREAEIGRLETVNGAELVGLKESVGKNKQTKENMLKMSGFMSETEKQILTDKLDKEEADKKERIKEKEEKIAEELNIFREPFEARLKETSEIENNLSEAFNFIKINESNLNKNIKECKVFIAEAQKLNLSDEMRADIVKNAEAQKAVLDARAEEFAGKKVLVSSKLEVLKNNKKEIEATLNRVNNIGKTKQEIVDKEKSKKEAKVETKPTEEKKDDGKKEKTWDETRDEVWGVNNTQETTPSDKNGGKNIDIGELFEHYGDVSEKNKENQKKEELLSTKDFISKYLAYQDTFVSDADKKLMLENTIKIESARKYAKALREIISVNSKEQIESIVSDMKTEAFDILEKIGVTGSPFLTSNTWAMWDIGKQYYFATHSDEADKKYKIANPLKSPEKISEIVDRHIGWEVYRAYNNMKNHDFVNKFHDTRQHKEILVFLNKKPKSNGTLSSLDLAKLGSICRYEDASKETKGSQIKDYEDETEKVENDKAAEKIFTKKEIEEIATKELKNLGIMDIKDRTMREQITGNVIMAVEAMIAKSKKPLREEEVKKEVGEWYRKYSKNYFKKGKQPKI